MSWEWAEIKRELMIQFRLATEDRVCSVVQGLDPFQAMGLGSCGVRAPRVGWNYPDGPELPLSENE